MKYRVQFYRHSPLFLIVLIIGFITGSCTQSVPQEPIVKPKKEINGLISTPPSRGEESNLDSEIIASRQSAITRAVQQVNPAVVSISVTGVRRSDIMQDPFFNYFFNPGIMQEYTSLGSGFIISPEGHILTNEHVIGRNSVNIQVGLSNGETYEASLIGRDEYADLALLKIQSDKPF